MDPLDAGTDPTNRGAIHLRSLERATHICAATMQTGRKDLPEILWTIPMALGQIKAAWRRAPASTPQGE